MVPYRQPRSRRRPIAADGVSIERLEEALLKVACLVSRDPAFTPVFERLERELADACQNVERWTEAQQRAKNLLNRSSNRNLGEKTGRVFE